MGKNKFVFPSVIPLESPEIAEFRSLRGYYKDWRERAAKMRDHDEEAEKWCLRKAYFDSDDLSESFYQYVKDFVASGFQEDEQQLDPRQHRKMCAFIVDPYKRKMLQASRGSQKSTIGALGYATRRIGREHVLTGKNRLRILFASENLEVAGRNMKWVKQFLEMKSEFIKLAGDHKTDSDQWGLKAMTSAHREEAALAEPTVSPISIAAGRTGFHYDLIIVDDLQAYSRSTTAEQIDNCDEFFKLLFSMLIQDGTGEFLILSTRWHNDDIYKRIEQRNEIFKAKQLSARQFKILKMPARDKKTGSILFPTIYTEGFLDEVRETQGARIYANQYMLEAVDDEDVQLRQDYVKWWTPQMLENRRFNIYITCDLAFTEEKKSYKGGKSDYTVILTVAIDENWNYFVLDWFRERCSKRTSMVEVYRQWDYCVEYHKKKPISVLFQKFDRSQFKESFDQYAFEVNRYLPTDWVSYPPNTKKAARIESSVVPRFQAGAIFLSQTMQWFLNAEYYDFPRGKYDDCLDALCNVCYISNPARKVVAKPKLNEFQRFKKRLQRTHREDGSWKTV